MKALHDEYTIEADLSPRLSGTRIVTYECYDSPDWEKYYELYYHFDREDCGSGIFYRCLNIPSKEEALFQLLEHRNKAGTKAKSLLKNIFS